MFRHGLSPSDTLRERTAELVSLKWSQIDLNDGYIEIRRVKHGHDSSHPLRAPELRALRQIKRDYPYTQYVFVSERKAPLSTRTIRHIIARAGLLAGLNESVHPHQLPESLWLLSCFAGS
jgi:type 1 fimbriae regulatory protein FimE